MSPLKTYRRRNQAAIIDGIGLISRDASEDFATGLVFALGDIKINKDGGGATDLALAKFFESPVGSHNYRLNLDATDLDAQRIVIDFIDTPAKTWKDHRVIIETYGTATAQLPNDWTNAAAVLAGTRTVPASTRAYLADNEDIVGYAAETWLMPWNFVDLDSTGWTQFVFSLKSDADNQDDDAAEMIVRISNPGVGGDGLIRWMGAATDGAQLAYASIVVSAISPDTIVTVNVNPSGADIPPGDSYTWELIRYKGSEKVPIAGAGMSLVRGVVRVPGVPT